MLKLFLFAVCCITVMVSSVEFESCLFKDCRFQGLSMTKQNDSGLEKKDFCEFCSVMMPIVRNLVAKNRTAHLVDIATYICKELKLAEENVCQLAIEEYMVS
jgi:hypothetical protein